MRPAMRRADLQRALAAVPPHPSPRAELEQYATPADVAAAFLGEAREDLRGTVLDLGCGTGVLSIGAALLGARVVAVDIDEPSLQVARAAAAAAGVADAVRFELADVAAWQPPRADCVIMNPPFGAQRKGADRPFYACARQALAHGGPAWLLAPPVSERFLTAYARDAGATIERAGAWDLVLPATMAHHEREAREIRVGAYRLAFRSSKP